MTKTSVSAVMLAARVSMKRAPPSHLLGGHVGSADSAGKMGGRRATRASASRVGGEFTAPTMQIDSAIRDWRGNAPRPRDEPARVAQLSAVVGSMQVVCGGVTRGKR